MRTNTIANRSKKERGRSAETIPTGIEISIQKNAPPNTLGLRSVMFLVDDIDDVVARLGAHGGELMGEVAQYEDIYRLCYLRGPADIIVALAEEVRA